MNIGEEIRTIRIEPAVVPVPQRERKHTQPSTPRPRRDPVPRHEPTEPIKEPVKVPERK